MYSSCKAKVLGSPYDALPEQKWGWGKVFSTDILKISVVTNKREYRIYQKFIGDTNKISEKN
jgi:hypothetical protein